MKITRLRAAAFVCAFSAIFFVGMNQKASAAYVDVQIGAAPPPPVIVEHPWARPYRGAVWIAGHYEWRGGRYVWIGGYYDYPPRHGAYWVGPRYINRGGVYYYRAGHWGY